MGHSQQLSACAWALPALLLLLLSALPQLTAQQFGECPCWFTPNAPGDCEAASLLPLVYTSPDLAANYTHCVNRVEYDARFGALQASLCFNRTCLPQNFRSQTLNIELNIGSEGLVGMEPGAVFVSNFVAPGQQGGNRLTTDVTAIPTEGPRIELQGDGTAFAVPAGGLSRLRIAWQWPDRLDATEVGNQAHVLIRNSTLLAVPIQWQGLPGEEDGEEEREDPCEPVKATGLDTEGESCGEGLVEIWVKNENYEFSGINDGNLPPEPEGVAALMCVDPPTYDRYTQLVEWELQWDFSCWRSRALPFVFQMGEVPSQEIEINGIEGRMMPDVARMRVMTRGEQVYRDQFGTEAPAQETFVSLRKINFPHFDGKGGFETFLVPEDDFTFHFPEEGVVGFGISTRIWGPPEEASPSSTRFLGLLTVPDKQLSEPKDVLKDKHTIIDLNTTYAIRGQKLYSAARWPPILGVRSVVQGLGWSITVPMMLRNTEVLHSCEEEDVDVLLHRLANATGMERRLLNASCLQLRPGQQNGYIEHLRDGDNSTDTAGTYDIELLASELGGQPTLYRCNDARFGLNITYNEFLDETERPPAQRTSEPTESELERPYVPPGDSEGAVTPLGFEAVAAAREKKIMEELDHVQLPEAIPKTKESSGKERALLQDNGGTAPDFSIDRKIRLAAIRMTSLFRQPDVLGGSNQYCVKPKGKLHTLMLVTDSILKEKKVAEEGGTALIPREGDRVIIGNQRKMDRICMGSIEASIDRLQTFLGKETPEEIELVHMTRCFGETNCVDCWPYEVLEVYVYQIVLIVCAFCLAVVAVLAARAYVVTRAESLQSKDRPGRLNDEDTIKRLIREQDELENYVED